MVLQNHTSKQCFKRKRDHTSKRVPNFKIVFTSSFPPKQKRVKGKEVIFYQKIGRENANCLNCSDKLLTETGKIQKTQNWDGPIIYIFIEFMHF